MSINKEIVRALEASPHAVVDFGELTEKSPIVIDIARGFKKHIKNTKKDKEQALLRASYTSIFKNPVTGRYGVGLYIPNYYGPDKHGVRFEGDDTVFAIPMVKMQLTQEVRVEDALEALRAYVRGHGDYTEDRRQEADVIFLNRLDDIQRARTQRIINKARGL